MWCDALVMVMVDIKISALLLLLQFRPDSAMASASLLLLLATATAATFSPSRCISGCGGSPALASFSDARTRITSSYNNYNSINSYNNHNSYSSYGQTRPAAPSPSPAWAEVVPSKLASVPGQVASIRWEDNI